MGSIHNIKKREITKQKTSLWYDVKNKMVTGTNLCAIDNNSKYKSSKELLNNKLNKSTSNTSEYNDMCMNLGELREEISARLFEKIMKVKVNEIGLIRHPKYKYIGASPDRYFYDSNRNICLLEIKNIISKNKEVSWYCNKEHMYQIQMQLEVAN